MHTCRSSEGGDHIRPWVEHGPEPSAKRGKVTEASTGSGCIVAAHGWPLEHSAGPQRYLISHQSDQPQTPRVRMRMGHGSGRDISHVKGARFQNRPSASVCVWGRCGGDARAQRLVEHVPHGYHFCSFMCVPERSSWDPSLVKRQLRSHSHQWPKHQSIRTETVL